MVGTLIFLLFRDLQFTRVENLPYGVEEKISSSIADRYSSPINPDDVVRADVREQVLPAGPVHRLARHRVLEDALLRDAEVVQGLGLAFVALLQLDLRR